MVALPQSPYFTFHSAYIKCKICYFIFLNVMYVYYTVGMAIDIVKTSCFYCVFNWGNTVAIFKTICDIRKQYLA